MKSIVLISVAALAVLPVIAHAQEPDHQFSGPKIGIEAGRVRTTVRSDPGAIGASDRSARSGVNYRGFAGYDWQIDNFVLGVEAGVEGGGRTVTQRGTNGRYSVDPGLSYDISGRAGLAVVPNLLLYGRLGYRWQETDVIRAPTVGAAVRIDRVEKGVTYGAGVEFALSRHFSLRTEYNRAPLSEDVRQNRFILGGTLRF